MPTDKLIAASASLVATLALAFSFYIRVADSDLELRSSINDVAQLARDNTARINYVEEGLDDLRVTLIKTNERTDVKLQNLTDSVRGIAISLARMEERLNDAKKD